MYQSTAFYIINVFTIWLFKTLYQLRDCMEYLYFNFLFLNHCRNIRYTDQLTYVDQSQFFQVLLQTETPLLWKVDN